MKLALMLASAGLLAGAPRQMVVTIDDLPWVGDRGAAEGTRRILKALAKYKAPAIGFVNESKGGAEPVFREWLKAGHELGNHTYSHRSLNKTPLPEFEQDVIRGETLWRPMMEARGARRFYFRHPFTHTGGSAEKKAAFETFLASRGYAVAPFTIEHSDYVYNAVLAAHPEREAEIVKAYLAHLDQALGYFESLAERYFGRAIPQILLIHSSNLNARALEEMLARMAKRGYRFVKLDEALRDAAYQTPDRFTGPYGPSWLHRWAIALGHPNDIRNEPDVPKWVADLYSRLPSK